MRKTLLFACTALFLHSVTSAQIKPSSTDITGLNKVYATQFAAENNKVNTTSFFNKKDDLLLKSKNQRTGAWVLLGSGAGLILIGNAVGNRKSSSFGQATTGGIIAIAGILSSIGSIPLFLASARNKRKAALYMENKNTESALLSKKYKNILSVTVAIPIGK